jgi:putative Mn2+ efflux pump MntP
VLAVLLVAVSVGLSNLAASIGLGAGGADRRTRLRVAIIFGLFEGGMPVAGLALGAAAAGPLGQAAPRAGAALLIAVGAWTLIQAARSRHASAGPDAATPDVSRSAVSTGRLLVTGLALSVDNLAVGFAAGTFPVGLVAAAVIIGLVSTAMSLAGLELGSRLGARLGAGSGAARGEVIAGVALVAVGALVAAGIL